jgi:hypothetical protein
MHTDPTHTTGERFQKQVDELFWGNDEEDEDDEDDEDDE